MSEFGEHGKRDFHELVEHMKRWGDDSSELKTNLEQWDALICLLIEVCDFIGTGPSPKINPAIAMLRCRTLLSAEGRKKLSIAFSRVIEWLALAQHAEDGRAEVPDASAIQRAIAGLIFAPWSALRSWPLVVETIEAITRRKR